MTKETIEFLMNLLLKFQGTPADDKGWEECLRLRKAKEELIKELQNGSEANTLKPEK